MKELPIGFIDSGYGGLTVVRQSLKQLPNESILFLGDSARCPYGPRPLSEVRQYIWQMTNFLMEKGIKMLVIACNTGTAAALAELRQQLSIPVVGVIASGSRAAIKQTRNNRIGIIGTQGTIASGVYYHTIKEKADHLQVDSLACPVFVDLVERGLQSDESNQIIIQKTLAPLEATGMDTLVLGCTHYPMMKEAIQKVVGSEVTLIDSGVETINEVSMLLDYFNLSRSAEEARDKPASQHYYTTGDSVAFSHVAKQWLQEAELEVKPCRIKGERIDEITHCQS